MTAQRHEIAAWVNATAWGDPDEADQVVDEIAALHTDDETAWLRVVARHDVQRAQRALDEAHAALQFAAMERAQLLRTLNRDNGISLYRLADWCGVSHQQMSRIVQKQE